MESISESPKLFLASWNVRGRAQPLRYLLEYLQLQYEEKRYGIQQDYQKWFAQDKSQLTAEFPDLPFLKDDNEYITGTEAICLYLCQKSKRMDLFGQTDKDQVAIATTKWILHYLSQGIQGVAENPDLELQEGSLEKLSQLSDFLGQKDSLLGYLTYVDFLLFEIIDITSLMNEKVLEHFENLRGFHRKFAEQEFMKEYINSSKFIARPFYEPAAITEAPRKKKDEDKKLLDNSKKIQKRYKIQAQKSSASNSDSSDSEKEKEEKRAEKPQRAIIQEEQREATGYTAEQSQQYQELVRRLKEQSNETLKDMLRRNDQPTTGSKDELVAKVADGKILGKIPRCPTCYGGRPRFDYKQGTYYCPGYRDDNDYKNCHKKYTLRELPREEWVD